MQAPQTIFPQWMRGFLFIVTIYHIIWGVFIGWFPTYFYQWATDTTEAIPGIIQWYGKGVLLMALAYFLATLYPEKIWYLIILGAFTKVLGAAWFYIEILEGNVSKKGWFHLLMNELLWVPLLIFVSYRAYLSKKA